MLDYHLLCQSGQLSLKPVYITNKKTHSFHTPFFSPIYYGYIVYPCPLIQKTGRYAGFVSFFLDSMIVLPFFIFTDFYIFHSIVYWILQHWRKGYRLVMSCDLLEVFVLLYTCTKCTCINVSQWALSQYLVMQYSSDHVLSGYVVQFTYICCSE